MTKPIPKVAPEAELQALIGAALAKAFPGIKLRYEVTFEVAVGHESITVDGIAGWEKSGRADIIAYLGNRALAVVELKRSDVTLTEKGRKQLLTYAAQHTPRPPLVVLSNGKNTKFFDGNDGQPINRKAYTSTAVQKLFDNAAKIAAADHDWTMETLLGLETSTWAGFVRQRSRGIVDRLTGSIADRSKIFASTFLVPRRLAYHIPTAVRAGQSVIMIEGAPLIGKSSLLRELVLRNGDGDLAFLFVRAGSGGAGLFQRIATMFASAVEWPFGEDDARHWVRRVSNADPAIKLVLAIDDLVPGSNVESDLEELADAGFGPGLAIVATVMSDQPRRGASGRDPTALEELAAQGTLSPLDTHEFEAMKKVRAKHGVHFTHGAALSKEYRLPWILRALLADLPDHVGTTSAVTMASTIGFHFVLSGRERIARFADADRGYRLLARDAFADEGPVAPELSLAMANGFVVRRDALSTETRELVPPLIEQGWISAFRHRSGDDVLVPRSPEMFLGAMAEAVSRELEAQVSDNPLEAGRWLADTMDGLFLGDLIGAQAVLDISLRQHGFSELILYGLLDRRPRVEPFTATVFGFLAPNGSIQNIRVTADGEMFEADDAGNAIGEALGTMEPEERVTQCSMSGWMILSQLAMIKSESLQTGQPAHPGILLEVATSEVPLLRFAGEFQELMTHDVEGHGSLLDVSNGVIETVTAALQQMIMREWRTLDQWFEDALARDSLPLLYRLRIALLASREILDEDGTRWASDRLDTVDAAILKMLET